MILPCSALLPGYSTSMRSDLAPRLADWGRRRRESSFLLQHLCTMPVSFLPLWLQQGGSWPLGAIGCSSGSHCGT